MQKQMGFNRQNRLDLVLPAAAHRVAGFQDDVVGRALLLVKKKAATLVSATSVSEKISTLPKTKK